MDKKFNCHFEVKSIEQDSASGTGYVSGLASTFGNKDRDGDVINKGAFLKSMTERMSLGKAKIPMLWQHDMASPIGGFPLAKMQETSAGLEVMGEINLGTVKGQEAYALLKAGDISDFSIGFMIKDQDRLASGDRVIKEVDLWEISLVTIPANASAQVSEVKSFTDTMEIDHDPVEIDSEKRWTDFCGGTSTERYQAGFIGKSLVVDIKDSKPVIKWASIVEQTIKTLIDGDKNELIEKLFSQREKPSPYRDGGTVDLDILRKAKESQIEAMLRKGLRFSKTAAKSILSNRDDFGVDSNSRDDCQKSLLSEINAMKAILKGK